MLSGKRGNVILSAECLGIFGFARFFVALIFISFLVGCSSHAPSASKFMNVKPNSYGLGLGATKALGDNYTETGEEDRDGGHHLYTEYPFILDGDLFFRIDHIQLGVSLVEDLVLRFSAGFVSDYLGVQTWIDPIVFDDHKSSLRPLGVMLIQQYPFTPNFKIGVSQFFANNSYADVYRSDCCSLDTDNYTIYYKEVGAGAYITYKFFSLEFRYGDELGSSKQRYYLDFNMMFSLPFENRNGAALSYVMK